jgi:hypothetical protein
MSVRKQYAAIAVVIVAQVVVALWLMGPIVSVQYR